MSTGTRTADTIIIGGGVIGLAVARALAQAGLRVAVLERGTCGGEASWAGAGIIHCGNWHRRDPLIAVQRDSVDAYAAFADELLAETGIDPEYERCGSFELLFDDQQVRMARSQVKVGALQAERYGRLPLELLAPEDARERVELAPPGLLGVLYCPLTAQVRNPRLLRALRSSCERRGVQLVERCPATGLVSRGDRVVGVQTPDGPWTGEHVVVAAGAWSASIAPELGLLLPVRPVRGQIVLLKQAQRAFDLIIEHRGHYLVPRRDGHVLVGATQEPEAGFEKRNTAEGVDGLLATAQSWLPSLRRAEVTAAWAGLRPGTPDGRPYLGPVPGRRNLWAATGHFRTGLTLAPVTAAIITDRILYGRCRYDLTRCAPGRHRGRPLRCATAL